MKFSMCINKKLFIKINAVLIGIIIALCVGQAFLLGFSLMQTVENNSYIIYITISIIAFSLLALGLTAITIKVASRKPSEEIHILLKRFKGEVGSTHHFSGEVSEIATALDEMMSELHGLLQSVQSKARVIDSDVEALTKGIHQVAADQTNLFSLSAAIETVRSKQNGFSVISSEILTLVERTGHLTENVRCMADQLRAGVNGVLVELEHVLRRVDPSRAGAPIDVSTSAESADSLH